ncbi:hypothetical protein LLG96_04600, partial [bacterium]|nr:hypothetical protein [bacterium]
MLRSNIVILCMVLLSFSALDAQNLSDSEKERKKLNDQFDKLGLREKTDFIVDRSESFLTPPATKPADSNYIVAKEPPTVKLRILPDMVPEYFTEGQQYMAGWANWAHVTRSDDNRFFFSVGDHRGQGCQINLYEYCPVRNTLFKVLDVDNLLGWTEYSYTDGKVHGEMGIMPDGTLWGATHYGVYPDSVWYANGYRGSWLFSYNIYTHEAHNWGVPLVGSNLPCFKLDRARGRLVASGAFKMILCWDCINKKVRYAGCPPNGWTMWQRAMLLDEETGKVWSCDSSDKEIRFLSFDPEYNKFERYEVSPPENPYEKARALLRGHTDGPAMDGWVYWITWNGGFLRCRFGGASGPVVEPLAVSWVKGRDC